MRVDIEVIDALGVERRCAPFHAMNDISLFQKELGKVAPVLARDAGDKRRFPP
jgi:hypothetical protein